MSRLHRSVFVKLVAVMAVMASSLLSLVGGFFLLVVRPHLDASVDRIFGEYARLLAAASPNEQAGREMAARLGARMRYEGPGGGWTTSAELPSIEEARRGRVRGGDFRVVDRPDGGAYVLAWDVRRATRDAHTKLVVLLLVLMVGVFVVAHIVLNRALRPLRRLHDGVARLSEGNLDVVVPSLTRDEFGELTDAFNRMVGRVREMVRARDRLLLDVSHELRSPLTRMKVALAMLPEDEKAQRLRADLGEMEAMITELLELERLRSGRAIEAKRQDLMPLVREAAASHEGQPPGVTVASAPAQAVAEFDAERVRTVLRNLIENAVKYSLPDSRAVEVAVSEERGAVVVRVADDGPGIPATDLGQLFEPFFRVDRSRSKKTGGYGLGLSICKRILEAHGGSIGVENRPGRGACFSATLPVNAEAQAVSRGL